MSGTWAIIQARTGSSRLPSKVLMDIAGKPMLEHVVGRTAASAGVDGVVVATSTLSSDDSIASLCKKMGCAVFRGSEHDVLDRYCRAADQVAAQAVVRLTADCPLLDPEVIDQTVALFFESGADYASNTLDPRTFPRGLDTEVVTRAALDLAGREATLPSEREHVTPFIWRRPEEFRIARLAHQEDCSQYRWTVDTPEDLELVRRIYGSFDGTPPTAWRHVLSAVRANPDRLEANRHVEQKPVL